MLNMNDINTNIFIDEVQIDKNEQKNIALSIYYFAVCTSVYQGFIQNQINGILKKYNINVFHAIEYYRKPTLKYKISKDISDIILNNNIKFVCYNFRKKDLENPNFAAYKEVNFTDWKLPKENYRAVSFYYFVHILNKFLPQIPSLLPKYRIIKHRDEWLEAGNGLLPNEQESLGNIKDILSYSTENAPCLILADHLCYLFAKCRRELPVDLNGKIIFKVRNTQSKFLKICFEYLKLFYEKGLFIYRDISDLMT